MDMYGYAYFVERPRRLEDLQRPHLIERERLYSIVTAVQLPKSNYLPFNDNSANMNYAQLWAFLIIIPGASIIDRKHVVHLTTPAPSPETGQQADGALSRSAANQAARPE